MVAVKRYFAKDVTRVCGTPMTTVVDSLAAQMIELAVPIKNKKDLASAAGLALDRESWKDYTK